RQIGEKFRKERSWLDGLLEPAGDAANPLSPGLEVLHVRSLRLAPIGVELMELAENGELRAQLENIALSHVHMHINRILRSAQNAQELVIYEFLARLYESRVARHHNV